MKKILLILLLFSSVAYGQNKATLTPTTGAWSLVGNTVTGSTHVLGSTNNASLRFITNNVGVAVLDSNGRLGIGTPAPGELLSLGLAGTLKGVLSLSGNTSGKVIMQPAAAAGTWTWTLPTDDGTANYFLQTDGNGVTSWVAGNSGTVTNVATGYGLSGGPITTTGTILVDSATIYAGVLSTVALTTTGTSGAATWNSTTRVLNIPQYTTDISGKLNISDTASMLAYYLRDVGYGLLRTGQVVRADSATLYAGVLSTVALTTTGTSGAATWNSTTRVLNIPQYAAQVYPGAGIAVSTGSAWGTSITDNSTNWNTAYTDRLKWDGGATGLTASTGRTSLGGTTIGQNIFTSTNPSAITFGRANADNTFDWLSAADFRTAIGAGTGSGTVTSVSFTGGLISVATATTTPALTVAGTSGGIPYFSSASTWASSAALAANAIVIGGGAGAAPATTTTGTGVLTALGINVGSAGAFVTFNGALGTPSSGTVTNLTGTASININGTVGATTPTTGAFTTITATTSFALTGSAATATIGGGATAAELRFLEPSGSGSNYTAFKTVAQGANITYSLPPTVGAAGTVLTDVAGNGVLTWVANPSGTVTSVSFTGGLISVATATTTPALTVAGTSGGIPYFSSASTWATSAALAANAIVIGGGAGAAPATTTTGTGVVTALGVNVGSAGAFVTFNGALGTPSSGTVTNLTGTASININGTVGATTPTTATFTTATINTVLNPDADGGAGIGSATLGYTILGLSSGATINFANSNVVLTHSSGILTVSTGDLRVTTAGTNAASVVTNAGTQTLDNKRITPRVQSVSSAATVTPNADSDDGVTITAQAEALTIANPSGTPTNMQELVIRVKDNGTARALTFGSEYRGSTDLALPTTTTISKWLYMKFIRNTTDTKWDYVAQNNGF